MTGNFTKGLKGSYYFGLSNALRIIDNRNGVEKFSVYPNPTNGLINVSFNSNGNAINLNIKLLEEETY